MSDVKLAIGPKHPTASSSAAVAVAAVATGRVGTGITGSVTVTASPKSKADRAAAAAAAAENDEYEARRLAKTAYRIRPFGVLVVLIIALGTSLLVTGAYLRMEKAPRTLFIAVNLCPDSLYHVPTFFGSGTLCYSEETSVQTMELSDEALVSDVDYVAFVVFPSGADVNGSITLTLRYGEKALFHVTQNLHAGTVHPSSAHHLLEHSFEKHSHIAMVTEFPNPSQLEQHCDSTKTGCVHALKYRMNTLVLPQTQFRIPSRSVLFPDGETTAALTTQVDLPPYVQLFAPNLTISFENVWLRGDSLSEGIQSDDPSAQMFVGFYQYGLSYVQSQGVTWIVCGVFVLIFGVGLGLARWCGGRPLKPMHHTS